MRIFKNKSFNKWAISINLTDKDILKAAYEVADSNYDASLGKKVFKKRIAIGNKGKSGSTRTLVAFKQDDNIFFMYGFAKGKRGNITEKETEALQMLAKHYFNYTEQQLNYQVKTKNLIEILEV